LCSYLAGEFLRNARRVQRRRGTGKSGEISIHGPGQEVIERNAVLVDNDFVEARFTVGLPARGRRILGREADELLLSDIPRIVYRSLHYETLHPGEIETHVLVNEDADALRDMLSENGLVAFIAHGAVLPRLSGVDDRPMKPDEAVPFKSPPELTMSFDLPNSGRISGMGIPRGVTLIVGGGFHGKSSLLNAIERGVYNHVTGDGREFVVTEPSAVKIRSEDGRCVSCVDISPFISNLPRDRDTHRFSTTNASGSTSQAANIIEALEAGAGTLLIDEDTAATNFMIRDRRMQELVSKDKEPITPFVDRAGQIFGEIGISTILVMGGSGDYFDAADCVIAMDEYVPRDVTKAARTVAERHDTGRTIESGGPFGTRAPRKPSARSLDPGKGRRAVNIKTRDLVTIEFGRETIVLSAVEQLVDRGQTRAIADALYYAHERYMRDSVSVSEMLDQVMSDIEREGLDVLSSRKAGDYVRFRRFELAAALNRIRTLEVK